MLKLECVQTFAAIAEDDGRRAAPGLVQVRHQ
jgi:hypothetical protein